MSIENKITCPSCGHQFEAEQAIEQKIRSQFNIKWKEELAKRNREQDEKFALYKLELEKNAIEERKKLELLAKEKAKSEVDLELKASKEELEAKTKQVVDLRNKEIEFLKKEREFADLKQQYDLEFQKKLLETQHTIEIAAKRKADEENQLAIKQRDMQLEAMKQQIEVMKKKSEQGSMQLQGEVQEIVLEELLKTSFPFDVIGEVGKGVKGADVTQTIRNQSGEACGTIIYESKRTKSFSNEWIDKLKTDLRNQKSDIAVIVTETMPKEMERFGMKDGIWICSFAEVKSLATVLRESLLRISEVKSTQENKGEKMQFLYDFLTGNEFKQHIESIVEGFSSMQEGLLKEKIGMQKIWNEREKQIEKVLLNMSGMYGSIRGIAGNALPEVKMLELWSGL